MRTELILNIREKQFQAWVEQAAQLLGWRYYHPYDSRRSVPGYPDLTLVHAGQGRVIFAELKTQTGRVTTAQREWLDDLEQAGQEVYVWRPEQWVSGEIHRILQRPH
jgi:hypothetical protein